MINQWFLLCFVMQVAYVLGQLQNRIASSTLSDVLKNVNEHPMVRHEAAEALGSIAGIFLLTLHSNLHKNRYKDISIHRRSSSFWDK